MTQERGVEATGTLEGGQSPDELENCLPRRHGEYMEVAWKGGVETT